MRVLIGNVNPKVAFRVPVPEDTTRAQLEATAEDWGVGYNDDYDDAQLRSILADHVHFEEWQEEVKNTITDIQIPEGTTIGEAYMTIIGAPGSPLWNSHSYDAPEWVWCPDSPGLEALLVEHWGCDAGMPDDVEERYHTPNGPPGVGPSEEPLSPGFEELKSASTSGGTINPMAIPMMIFMVAWLFFLTRLQLRTNAGIDHQSAVTFGTAAQPAAANYIGVTENNAAPAVGDTALTGELSGEGLSRAQATYAHTNGTNTTTLTKTFTKTSGADRTLAKAGLFNAAAAGTMSYTTLISPVAALTINDSVAFTWTFTF